MNINEVIFSRVMATVTLDKHEVSIIRKALAVLKAEDAADVTATKVEVDDLWVDFRELEQRM